MDPDSLPFRPDEMHESHDWGADGFEIPPLKYVAIENASTVAEEQRPFQLDNLYLGPHGASLSKLKQERTSAMGRKQKFKQKLKEADKKKSSSG